MNIQATIEALRDKLYTVTFFKTAKEAADYLHTMKYMTRIRVRMMTSLI